MAHALPTLDSSQSITSTSNERCAVFQLPSELMNQIVRSLSPPTLTGSTFTERLHSAFALSHTCKWWRDIVLSDPQCWSYIPCTNAHWLDEGLRRSEGALLHLFIDVSTLSSLHLTVNRLYQHVERVETLALGEMTVDPPELTVFAKGQIRTLMSLLSRPYPVLRQAWLLQWSDSEPHYSFPLPIPKKIFGGRNTEAPPMLTHLTVSDVGFTKALYLCKAPLTHFEIVRGKLWRCVDDTVTFFRNLPQLEVFVARDCRYLAAYGILTEETYPPRGVSMPSLRHFTCVGSLEVGLEVIKLLSLPPTCDVHVTDAEPRAYDNSTEDNTSDWETTLTSVHSHLETIRAIAMNEPTAGFSLGYRRLPGKHATEITLKLDYMPVPGSSKATSFEVGVYIANNMIRRLFDIIPSFVDLAPQLFANTRTLRLKLTNFKTGDKVPDLWQAAEQMPIIEKLVLAGGAAKVLCDHVKRNPSSSLGSAFPQLRTLVFDHPISATKLAALVWREKGSPVEVVYSEGGASQ
ncbi:hypothetical protein PENSPDRAFT_658583 [Peniophora sp. CONT]|nr:hypothetical protein PENSPDRAFT_658583 [Peniophora sp. CONT]